MGTTLVLARVLIGVAGESFMHCRSLVFVLLIVAAMTTWRIDAAAPAVERAFAQFWAAENAAAAAAAADAVVKAGANVDETLATLKRGRIYPAGRSRTPATTRRGGRR